MKLEHLILPDRKCLKNDRNLSKDQKGQLDRAPFKAKSGKILIPTEITLLLYKTLRDGCWKKTWDAWVREKGLDF